MNKRILPPPIVLLSALAILLACFHESLIEWWCLRDLPKSLNQIYGETTQNKIPVYCFEDGFRAQIPIFKSSSSFYTSYDFNENYLKGLDTVYVSVNGKDENSGSSRTEAKRTIESALHTRARTIIMTSGIYRAGENFCSDVSLVNVNLIGEGDVVVDNVHCPPMVIKGNVFIRNIEFINGSRGSLRTYIDNSNDVCTYINCKFNKSLVDNEDIGKAQSLGGLRIQGGTHYLYKCEASYNGLDGFSYHSAPDGSTNSPHVVEVECKAFHNGEKNAYESNNASTAHDGTHVIRLNCEYGYSHGGNVADVHKNTISFNLGCTSYSVWDLGTENRSFQSNYFCASGAVMYLLGCKSYGSYYDLSCWGKGVLFTDRNYKNNYVKDGTFTLLR